MTLAWPGYQERLDLGGLLHLALLSIGLLPDQRHHTW